MRALGLCVLAACASGPTAPPAVAWMDRFDDATSLAALSIPGTHDSGAHEEPYPGLAKTQDLSIAEQLDAGVRFFDVRCRHYQDAFLIYHGGVDQEQTFEDVLAAFATFLAAHPREVVIASVKEESVPDSNTRTFEATFRDYVARGLAPWRLAGDVPMLGAARGQLVLLRRFTATGDPLGLDASVWPDNTSFTIDGPPRLRVQDAYVVTSNDAKWAASEALLAEAAAAPPGDTTLYLDFTSGYQEVMGLPNITLVSDDLDARLDAKLAGLVAHLGVLIMDHVTRARVAAVIATNP